MKIIANPRAGHGSNARSLDKLHSLMKRRGLDYELLQTREPGHATELARQWVAAGVRELVVMGGDGTIGEVIHGVASSGIQLGLISVGTGNDLARTLGLPYNNVEASLEIILSGQPKPMDVGWERDRHFILMLGLGFPALVAHEVNRMRWLKGSAAFFAAVYKALHRMEEIPLHIELDDRTLDLRCTSVLIQNTRYCGGGQLMAPTAEIDDGFLDVLVVHGIGRLSLMLNFPKVYSGRHLEHPAFSMYRSRSVRITSDEPLQKLFDGDLCGTTPLEARVLQRTVEVIVP